MRHHLQPSVSAAFRDSRYRRAAEAAGFTFSEPEVLEDSIYPGNSRIRGTFQCVCGKTEFYVFIVTEMDIRHSRAHEAVLDPASQLHSFGSFSMKHLLEDGYPEPVAREIVNKFNDALKVAA